jgi:hypothetical protein
MSIFLTDQDMAEFAAFRRENTVGDDLFHAVVSRACASADEPGIHGTKPDSRWWYSAPKSLTEAALAYVLEPEERIGTWIADATLSLVRRSDDDWSGPAFRLKVPGPTIGYPETAQLSWTVAIVLDLVPGLFSESEHAEICEVLRSRGLSMCRRWMDQDRHLNNWRCVLNAGHACAAVLLDDRDAIEASIADYRVCLEAFQRDGSYGESLVYANYAAYALVLTREALTRREPALASRLPIEPYVFLPRWFAASLLYQKPLDGWGPYPQARSANFNDSSSFFRPSGTLLLHIATRARESHPAEAGLARWLFDTLYRIVIPAVGLGQVNNDFGPLAISLIAGAASAISPTEADLPETAAFSCGDVIARDRWGGRTVLAIHGGGDPLHAPGHLHGDLNSFILTHNEERMLADPGCSCYRNLIHDLEMSTRTHNTCTFSVVADSRTLEQSRSGRRALDPDTRELGDPFDRGARCLLAERRGAVSAIGSEVAAMYGSPIERFSRFWFLCGTHVVFVVDHIVCTEPVLTSWHWLLNNRDSLLEYTCAHPDSVTARRGRAGMKLIHLGGAALTTPQYAFVHDAQIFEGGQQGEGSSGSGILVTWRDTEPQRERTVTHAIALDGYGSVVRWNLAEQGRSAALENDATGERWSIAVDDSALPAVTDERNRIRYLVRPGADGYSLTEQHA